MTTDVMINNIINELCQKFNVAASDLVPRLQAYGMAMSLYGVVAGLIFVIAIIITAVFLIKKYDDEGLAVVSIAVILEIIPVIVVLCNMYAYIGWKYAPEVKSIEYIMQLFKN